MNAIEVFPLTFQLIWVFLFGICLGSFLNVVIFRIPRGRSIVFPGSACTFCGHLIPWWENIPLLSYIFLGGKCRTCRTIISSRYFLVELLTGLVGVFLYRHFYPNFILFLYYYIFYALLVAVFFIDLDHWIIPDEIILFGLITGLLGSFFLPGVEGKMINWTSGLLSLGGILAGYLSFYLLSITASLFAKQDALGYGDVKFAALIGAFIGLKINLLLAFFSAFLLGGLYAIPLMLIYKLRGKTPLPFGTFMALGAFICVIWGDYLWSWYQRMTFGTM